MFHLEAMESGSLIGGGVEAVLEEFKGFNILLHSPKGLKNGATKERIPLRLLGPC
jgi:hypothetical protein